MSWAVLGESPRVFFDEEGDPEYLLGTTKLKCSPNAGLKQHEAERVAAEFDRADGSVSIFPHQKRWRGSLGMVNLKLHGPILSDNSKPAVVVVYRPPTDESPNGFISFDVFLPEKRFEQIAKHLDRMIYAERRTKVLVHIGFFWFHPEPNWEQTQVPTLNQFRAKTLSPDHRPYVTDRVEFVFADDFPFAKDNA